MGDLLDAIATLLILTTFRLENEKETVGPRLTDPKKLMKWTPRCPDGTNVDQLCSDPGFDPLVVNKVVSMVRKKETVGTAKAVCGGTKLKVPTGETDPVPFTCAIYALFDITITYK